MTSLLTLLCNIAVLAALAVILRSRSTVHWRWFAGALALIALNDATLTRLYGTVPDFVAGRWNWTGKLLAIAASLALLWWRPFNPTVVGARLHQAPEGRRSVGVATLVLVGLFTVIALVTTAGPVTPETLLFQATLPGLEEELFYRGILLAALDRAFPSRWRAVGVDWTWGSAVSCVAFGLAHAANVSDGTYQIASVPFAVTAIPAAVLIWLRLRSDSLVVPIVLHNYANLIGLLL